MIPPRARGSVPIRLRSMRFLSILVCLLAAGCGPAETSPEAAATGEPTAAPDPRIAAVESGLLPRVPATAEKGYALAERMRHYDVPGISVAVIENFELAWAKGYGVADRDTGEAVTTATLFQAGSISKPVAATGAMVQVEAGKLGLDQPINELLRSWQLPENELTAATPVTLRHLLSHTGGTTVHGFPGYTAGYPVPTTVQVLDGEAPANTAAIRVDIPPGERMRYSGGGTTIVQLALADLSGRPFADLLEATVLAPLAMSASTYAQPLPAERLGQAAAGHHVNGRVVVGKRNVYPEMAAAGLWTTASDLARFGSALQRALRGDDGSLLAAATVREMLQPVLGAAGLGFFVDDKAGSVYFSHGGADHGFQARLILHRDDGYGAAVMTNSNRGARLAEEVIRSIAEVYGWRGFVERIEPRSLAAESLSAYVGRYRIRDDLLLHVTATDGRLRARVTGAPATWLLPAAEHVFVAQDDASELRFLLGEDGRATAYVNLAREGAPERPRLADEEVVPVDLLEAGRVDEALALYRPIAAEDPRRVDRLARRALEATDPERALPLLELNTELHPEDAELWDSLGRGYLALGRREAAAAAFAKVLQVMPDYRAGKADLAARLERRATIELQQLEARQKPAA